MSAVRVPKPGPLLPSLSRLTGWGQGSCTSLEDLCYLGKSGAKKAPPSPALSTLTSFPDPIGAMALQEIKRNASSLCLAWLTHTTATY